MIKSIAMMPKLFGRAISPARNPEVSILIPAYAAERFIDRTLYFARGQTFSACTIVVSVDPAGDRTADIVRRHAAKDARIVVAVHERRLGWAGNVNYLLRQVRTPFYFIYFHDDILLPQYTEALLNALKNRPDAASAHCDMGHFGGGDHISIGVNYEGSPVNRLLTFFLAPERGSPLRSLIRADAVGDLRLPENAIAGLWANEPFLMELLTAGPAIRVDKPLYLRWDKRSGGLTDGWRDLPVEDELSGHKANLVTSLNTIDRISGNDSNKAMLTFALYLNFFPRLQQLEQKCGHELITRPADLHPDFSNLNPEISAQIYGEEFSRLAALRWESIQQDPRNKNLQRVDGV